MVISHISIKHHFLKCSSEKPVGFKVCFLMFFKPPRSSKCLRWPPHFDPSAIAPAGVPTPGSASHAFTIRKMVVEVQQTISKNPNKQVWILYRMFWIIPSNCFGCFPLPSFKRKKKHHFPTKLSSCHSRVAKRSGLSGVTTASPKETRKGTARARRLSCCQPKSKLSAAKARHEKPRNKLEQTVERCGEMVNKLERSQPISVEVCLY